MNMIKVKTAELSGSALDWAVAQIEGVKTMMLPREKGSAEKRPFALFGSLAYEVGGADQEYAYAPSSCWHCGGPLIEKYQIGLAHIGSDWHGEPLNFWVSPSHDTQGETPLIAACRAIVASKLGDVVQVPADLTGGAA